MFTSPRSISNTKPQRPFLPRPQHLLQKHCRLCGSIFCTLSELAILLEAEKGLIRANLLEIRRGAQLIKAGPEAVQDLIRQNDIARQKLMNRPRSFRKLLKTITEQQDTTPAKPAIPTAAPPTKPLLLHLKRCQLCGNIRLHPQGVSLIPSHNGCS